MSSSNATLQTSQQSLESMITSLYAQISDLRDANAAYCRAAEYWGAIAKGDAPKTTKNDLSFFSQYLDECMSEALEKINDIKQHIDEVNAGAAQ